MAILAFSLNPEATARFYEALVCLAKFGDSVSIEARSEKARHDNRNPLKALERQSLTTHSQQITLTTLNSSQTAYASFAFDAKSFFTSYKFNFNHSPLGREWFTCRLLNKALQSVFKNSVGETRGRDTGIEKCEVTIQDEPDQAECRLIVKMIAKHGMTKTYRLTYESAEVMHALFDKVSANQGWRISSRILREYIEFFGPKTDQLDLLARDGKAIFTSFLGKVQDGKEVLKQPLETAISIHTDDFDDFHMQENIHIVISVKDFRAIVTHAETLRSAISAQFSLPSRPLQFSYHSAGLHCEFTLMTTGSSSETPTPQAAGFVSTRASSRQPSMSIAPQESRASTSMPPPARPPANKPLSSQNQLPSLRERVQAQAASQADHDPESLFIPDNANGENDRSWDPPNFDDDGQEDELLGWDTSNERSGSGVHLTFQNSGSNGQTPQRAAGSPPPAEEGLEPTQRLSQIHGLFD